MTIDELLSRAQEISAEDLRPHTLEVGDVAFHVIQPKEPEKRPAWLALQRVLPSMVRDYPRMVELIRDLTVILADQQVEMADLRTRVADLRKELVLAKVQETAAIDLQDARARGYSTKTKRVTIRVSDSSSDKQSRVSSTQSENRLEVGVGAKISGISRALAGLDLKVDVHTERLNRKLELAESLGSRSAEVELVWSHEGESAPADPDAHARAEERRLKAKAKFPGER